MSAAVCGSKRSHYFFDDVPSPPLSKRLRYGGGGGGGSPSLPRFSPPPSLLDQLNSLFPDADPQLLERSLEECGNDLDSAIKKVRGLCLAAAESNLGSAAEIGTNVEQGTLISDGDAVATENTSASSNLPADGAEWVEFFVREMTSATSVNDAKARAARVLELLDKSITAHAGEEAAQGFQKENMVLKEQIEGLIQENSILKRAVAIQHERQKDLEEKNQELQQLKLLVSQYQEQIRTLEVNNYALTMHLRHAQQSSPMPGRFHPDVF